MARSYEDRRKRQAICAFLAVYLTFMFAVIALEMVRSHDLGYGLF